MSGKCDVKYWLWLQYALGAGAPIKGVIDEFGSPQKLYIMNILEWRMSPSLSAKQIERLESTTLNDVEQIIYSCEQNGWKIIAYDDERYPQKLRNIPNPPAVLYVDGELTSFDDHAVIGIVGTRKASPYAQKVAKVMAKGLSLCNAVVVSGGALGVDSAAHEGAFSAGAKTFAVLGNGFASGYLKANQELRDKIVETGGALITEYPPFYQATKYTFPTRNRIISGLSDGVLVVEAGEKSGSIITATHAAEQGRDIFAIPASILDYNFLGTNKLIDDGATVATSPAIILEKYEYKYKTLDMSKLKTVRELFETKTDEANASKKDPQVSFDTIKRERAERLKKEEIALGLEGNENLVYKALGDELSAVDEISEKSGLDSSKALAALTMLEMKGLAESASGKRYRLK